VWAVVRVVVRPVFRPCLAAFGFLTRVPVGRGTFSDGELGRAVGFFPLVGAVLGLALAGLGAALADTPLAPSLHLDGLADLFDALGGGRGDRGRMLEIMRDSRVGAHGAAALVLVLMAKVLVLGQVLARHDLGAVIAFPAVARWAVGPAIVFVPYARPEGVGRAFKGAAGPGQLVLGTLITVALVAALEVRLLVPMAAALAVVALLALAVRRRLGGLTGDVYGAAIELGEVTVLLGAVLQH
jgi:adenosylcobinamide-GDP ribazoletransferase